MIKEENIIEESKKSVENYYLQMNKLMQLLVGFMFIVTIVGAAVRVKEGMATNSYLIVAILVFLITEIASMIIIKKEANSIRVGYILFGGYSVVYIMSLFTSTTIMTVVTAFPILMALIIYRNKLLSRIANITVVTFIAVFLFINYENIARVDISILLGNMVMFIPINLVVNWVMGRIWNSSVQVINDANIKNEELENVLAEVTNLSKVVTETSNNLDEVVNDLGEGTKLINKSIEAISSGARCV